MSDLITTGTSEYAVGLIDSATVLISNVSPISAKHPNGIASGVVQIETILGSGTALKGSMADLVARLAVAINATGTVKLDGFTGLTADRGLTAVNGSTLQVMNHTPIGMISPFAGGTAPVNWLLCDGQAVSRTTYSKLAAAIYTPGLTNTTVTITIASPGVVTWTAHPFKADDSIIFTTTGALPTGISANTSYYVKSPSANSFQLAASPGGSAINTSGTQSGVHTGYHSKFGHGDGSTTFNVPDIRGRAIVMVDGTAGRITSASTDGSYADTLGGVGGSELLAAHTHNIDDSLGTNVDRGSDGGVQTAQVIVSTQDLTFTVAGRLQTESTGQAGVTGSMPPWIALNYIIFAGV